MRMNATLDELIQDLPVESLTKNALRDGKSLDEAARIAAAEGLGGSYQILRRLEAEGVKNHRRR